MTKTPEEMAEEYANKHEIGDQGWGGAYGGFIAGYKAGHHDGFQSCLKIQEAVTEHLEKQMIDEMYVRIEPLLKRDK